MSTQKIIINQMEGYCTPESMAEIEQWIEGHPKEDRAKLWTAVGMSWNFLAESIKLVQEFGGDSHEHMEERG